MKSPTRRANRVGFDTRPTWPVPASTALARAADEIEVLACAVERHDAIQAALAGDDQRARLDAPADLDDVLRLPVAGPRRNPRRRDGAPHGSHGVLGGESESARPGRQGGHDFGRQSTERARHERRRRQPRMPDRTFRVGIESPPGAGSSDEDERGHASRPRRGVVDGQHASERHADDRGGRRRFRVEHRVDPRCRPVEDGSGGAKREGADSMAFGQRRHRRRHPLPVPLDAGNQHDGRPPPHNVFVSHLVPERLPRLEHVRDSLERLAFAAQGKEGLALEIEKVALADRRPMRHVGGRPARHDPRESSADRRVVIREAPGTMRKVHPEEGMGEARRPPRRPPAAVAARQQPGHPRKARGAASAIRRSRFIVMPSTSLRYPSTSNT